MDVRDLIVAGVIAVALSSALSAAQYYVSSTGSDTAAGSSAAPWKTLQHAADAVGAGDRVTVRAGNYVGFDLRRSGAPGAPIEFYAEVGAIINAPSRVRSRDGEFLDGINLEGASHIVIDGFTIFGMPEAGVRSVGFSNNFAQFVTVRNVTTSNNGVWGIFTGHVNDLLIESNYTSGSVKEHGIYVSNSGDRPVIRNNVSYNNRANGIHMNGDIGEGGDGIISGALVTGNKIYGNGVGGGSGINMDGVQNSRIENNLLYDNHASGISLYRIDGGGVSSSNIVTNNTILVANDSRWAINIQNASTSNTIRNNILLNLDDYRGAINISPDSLPGFSSDYNALIPRFTLDDGDSRLTLTQWQSAGRDLHSFASDAAALFVNPAANDYRLKSGSPAINAGTSSNAPVYDFAGLPRPAGGAFDIGAFEFGALAGDYSRDGKVDAADYAIWRKTLEMTVSRFSGADGDGSGIIDPADYARWRAGFGAVPAGIGSSLDSASVPEPSALSLLGVSLVLLGVTRHSIRVEPRR